LAAALQDQDTDWFDGTWHDWPPAGGAMPC
jgi:hypothetical protein